MEFFKDGSPTPNKMMNFHHFESSAKQSEGSNKWLINFQVREGENNNTNSTNCTNQTDQNKNETKQLTPEDVQKILHKENQALKKEILSNEDSIQKDLKKMGEKIEKKLDEAEVRIGDKIVRSQDILEHKIDKLEEKVDENIQQTEEASILIISQQIDEKKKDLETLKSDIESLREIVNNEAELTDVCGMYSACDECTTNPKCGWCALEGRCVGGDNLGPNEDSCTFYTFHYCTSLSCARNTDCYVNLPFFFFFNVYIELHF